MFHMYTQDLGYISMEFHCINEYQILLNQSFPFCIEANSCDYWSYKFSFFLKFKERYTYIMSFFYGN